MKAITIKRLMAWAVAAGFKGVENRTWKTNHRADIGIHAGKGWDKAAADDPRIVQAAAAAAGGSPAGALLVLTGAPDVVPSGALVAVAELVDICSAAMEGKPCRCGVWAQPRHYHWRLARVRPLPQPVPCRGAQGLWTVPAEHLPALQLATAGRTT